MAWTELTRRQKVCKSDGYSSDVAVAEWAIIGPLLPGPKRLGRPREVGLRDVGTRDPICCGVRVCMVASAEGLSACFDGALLFLPLVNDDTTVTHNFFKVTVGDCVATKYHQT